MTDPTDWNWGDTSSSDSHYQQRNQNNPYYNLQNQVNDWGHSSQHVNSGGAGNIHHRQQPDPYAQHAQPSYGQPPTNNTGYGVAPGGYLGDVSMFSQQLMSEPMMSAARQLGGQYAEQQKEKIAKYLSTYRLKYYFAVDNAYVGKKIGLLLFPFLHRDWTVKFGNSDEPVPARFDINAPDLYIPLMAFVTYLLISGFVLGIQGRFSPEQLGLLTSNALMWLFLENLIVFITKYVMNISHALSFWHTLAFSGYKYIAMNMCLLMFLIGGRTVYYSTWAYTSLALIFFLLRTVNSFIVDVGGSDGGHKRKLYLMLFISLTQPFLIWWLTNGTTVFKPGKMDFAEMAMGMVAGRSMIGGNNRAAPGIPPNAPLLPDGEVDYEALLKMP